MMNMDKINKMLNPPKPKKKTEKQIFEIPSKYTKGLSKEDAKKKTKNVKESKELLKKGKVKEASALAKKRPTTKDNKQSSYTIRFKKKFPNIKPLTKEMAEATGISLSVQRQVVKRGRGAFVSAGSRATVSSATQWALARLYAFYFKSIDNKLDFDKDLAEKVKFKK
jgi:hypothetical protein